MTTTCRTSDSARFLAGCMSAAETSAFEDHLESCAACRSRLEGDAGGEEAWQSVRELFCFGTHRAGRPGSNSAAVSESSGPDSEWPGASTSTVVLSFLAPSDDPAMVGRVGPYEISGLVGRGSAGIVLKGFDRALSRNVAIKVLDPSLADVGAARQRFAREARAIAAISHEHVVPVYEVSEHAGLPYFVMEYMPGGSLERRLRAQGPFDVVSVVRIGLQTAQALAAAHAQGLVHRDIKPGNILLDRGTERVRVADFGLVRVANDASCTRSGIITGTPQYMSPEQVRAETCDGQSDLFSLGAVLYALCTGHAPFRGETVYGVMQRIVHDAPAPIRGHNPLVPAWLERFILRLLSKERAARFRSADDVVRILQEELACLQDAGRPIPLDRSWMKSWPATPARSRRWLALAARGFAALVAVIGGGLLWNARSPETSLDGAAGQPSEAADRTVAASPPPSVPLWNADGTDEARALARAMENLLHDGPSDEAYDSWNLDVRQVRRRLTELSRESP